MQCQKNSERSEDFFWHCIHPKLCEVRGVAEASLHDCGCNLTNRCPKCEASPRILGNGKVFMKKGT